MYTAKVTNKEFVNGAIKVTVEFTNGTDTITESCIPQDYDGFKFWVKSRLATFNGAKDIDTTFSVNDTVDITEPTPEEPVLTQEEIDRNNWLAKYRQWVKVKTTLIDTGVLTGSETPVQNLKTAVSTGFKAAYVEFI